MCRMIILLLTTTHHTSGPLIMTTMRGMSDPGVPPGGPPGEPLASPLVLGRQYGPAMKRERSQLWWCSAGQCRAVQGSVINNSSTASGDLHRCIYEETKKGENFLISFKIVIRLILES